MTLTSAIAAAEATAGALDDYHAAAMDLPEERVKCCLLAATQQAITDAGHDTSGWLVFPADSATAPAESCDYLMAWLSRVETLTGRCAQTHTGVFTVRAGLCLPSSVDDGGCVDTGGCGETGRIADRSRVTATVHEAMRSVSGCGGCCGAASLAGWRRNAQHARPTLDVDWRVPLRGR